MPTVRCASIIIVGMLFTPLAGKSQFAAGARQTIDTLTSKTFWGRGYTNGGMAKAANYLQKAFHAAGLQSVGGNSYLQQFAYPVNTFPAAMEVSINGKLLAPGRDFIVAPGSRGFKGQVLLSKSSDKQFVDDEKKVQVTLAEKLTWSVAQNVADYTNIIVLASVLKEAPATGKINISQTFQPTFKASNVIGMVKGTARPDSFLLITAHYDHLGGMGARTFFPGANDNASGIAMLLEMARYYGQHPSAYSMVFIAFAGEEAGLLGSRHFVEHPLFPLSNIRFLVNIDLVGTGTQGITVVNATEFPQAFASLNAINDSQHLMVKINARGKAANSDHYWFTEKGVPAFFMYTLGGISAYHDVFDKAETLPLDEFDDLMRLLIAFNKILVGEQPH